MIKPSYYFARYLYGRGLAKSYLNTIQIADNY
jgi:hypothetical protein